MRFGVTILVLMAGLSACSDAPMENKQPSLEGDVVIGPPEGAIVGDPVRASAGTLDPLTNVSSDIEYVEVPTFAGNSSSEDVSEANSSENVIAR